MADHNTRSLVKVDDKEMTFHEFEKMLFNKDLTGEEKICSHILTDDKEKILKETRLWEIVHVLLEQIQQHDEFSDRLREEIRKVIFSDFDF